MQTWLSHPAILLKEWIIAQSVIFATFLCVKMTRAILRRLHQNRNWSILQSLAQPLSNLIYIFGMRLFADLAPLTQKFEAWLNGGIYILSIILFLDFIQKLALAGIEWSTLKTNNTDLVDQGFVPLLRNTITLFIFFSGGIMILKYFNYDVMSLITALGVSSLAVGLAAKETLSNMISGFILIIDRNLHPGDRVNLNGSIGDVLGIGLRSTQIRMGNGNTLIVPNSELVNTKILNLSIPNRKTTCSLYIRVPYSSSFSRVKTICMSVMEQIQQISTAQPPTVNLMSLSEGHQLIQIGFWIFEINDSNAAISAFNEKLLGKLSMENIPLLPPFLQKPQE